MSKNLVIVESPAKAKTIEKFLGSDFKVLSSIGHIRSIPKKTKDGTPPIDIKNGFQTTYEIDSDKKKTITELKKAVKAAETVWLATDEDREGEAIAWHLCEVLKLDNKKTKRIVFHEITESAIKKAIENPRYIDMSIVQAQQARQILDRIVGFELSPVVWQKVPGGKSAGRVQSPAVRLLVEREREIRQFEGSYQFKVTAEFIYSDETIAAELSTRFDTEEEAREFLAGLKGAEFTISAVKKSPNTRNPGAPFTTSTLQQEANAKLSFSSKATMAAAQKLYQAGKITYMRTDSVNLSPQAIGSIANYVKSSFGENYSQVRTFKTKSSSAQEAHEAIRPTNIALETASSNEYDQRLYDLIRRRTLASQMASARLEKTTVTIEIGNGSWEVGTGKSPNSNSQIPSDAPRRLQRGGDGLEFTSKTETEGRAPLKFVAKGEIVLFDGFLRVYGGGKKEPDLLPNVKEGDGASLESAEARQIFARPPARYSEGSLVKKLEDLGIGRPSTYATIIDTIQTRGYVEKGETEGEPRDTIVLQYAPNGSRQPDYPDTSLTDTKSEVQSAIADETVSAEERIRGSQDTISRQIIQEKTGSNKGKLVPTPAGELIASFLSDHFTQVVDYDFTANVEKRFDEIANDKLERNEMLQDFYEDFHSLIEKSGDIDRSKVGTNREVGTDPKTGKPIFARFGRFGPMLQLGHQEDDDKPQFAPIPKDKRLETITLDEALEAFKLPRLVGQTPDGQDIRSNVGRFGPFIQIGTKTKTTKPLYVSLKEDDPHDITLERALELYDEKLKAEAEKNIADFGDGTKVLNGRFGPYITDGTKNAKIPKDTDPKTITHEQAKKMLTEAPAKKGRTRRATSKRKK